MVDIQTLLDATSSSTDQGKRPEFLDELERKITDYRQDLANYPLLRAVATWWLLRKQDVPASSAAEAVERRLHEVGAGNEMFNGPDEFPDDCEGCPHYGVACPVVTDPVQLDRLKSVLDEPNPDTLRRKLRTFSRDNDCKVLLNRLNEIDREHGPLVTDGLIIRMLCEERLLVDDDATSEMLASIEALPEGARGRLEEATNGNYEALVRGDDVGASPADFGLDESHPAEDVDGPGGVRAAVDAVEEDLQATAANEEQADG